MATAANPRPHGEAAEVMQPTPVVLEKSRRGFFRTVFSFTMSHFVLIVSILGSLGMLAYQYFFSWGHVRVSAEQAWTVGLVMLIVFVVTKLPHLVFMKPGGYVGAVIEASLNVANIVMATVFLTRVYHGMDYATSSVGIATAHAITFYIVMVVQIIWIIRITERTWTDTTS